MIKTFRSKPLEHFFNGDQKGIEAALRRKVGNILASLNTATDIEFMNLPDTACTS